MSENKITVAEVFKACSEPGYAIKVDGQEIDSDEYYLVKTPEGDLIGPSASSYWNEAPEPQ